MHASQGLCVPKTPTSPRLPVSCILVWLDGGPSTIDMWSLPTDGVTGGPFKAIPSAGEMEICQHLPRIAAIMDELSIINSMSTSEASHEHAYYHAHTGFSPNPNVTHPCAGSRGSGLLAVARAVRLPWVVTPENRRWSVP